MPRFIPLLFALFAFTAPPVWADAIEDVISGQLNAFTDRDIVEAWNFASPMIQKRFVDPRSFSQMVEQGYGTIWDNKAVRFGPRAEMDGRARQIVIVTGPDGLTQSFEFEMVKLDGIWRINGVRLADYVEPTA